MEPAIDSRLDGDGRPVNPPEVESRRKCRLLASGGDKVDDTAVNSRRCADGCEPLAEGASKLSDWEDRADSGMEGRAAAARHQLSFVVRTLRTLGPDIAAIGFDITGVV